VLIAMAFSGAHAAEFYASALLCLLVVAAYRVFRWKRDGQKI